MLERILQLMATGQAQSLDDLARELDISIDLVSQMLADLERLGYLASVGAQCGSGCEHCPVSSGCAGSSSPIKRWSLTEKGHRVADQ